jgi:hypothetical protein
MTTLFFVLFFWIAPVFVGHKIGAPKNRAGWAWGLLGWLGVIIVACLGPAAATGHQSFRLTNSAPAHAAAVPPPNRPAAGWYADPELPGQIRYWDGSAWTTYSSPADAPAV